MAAAGGPGVAAPAVLAGFSTMSHSLGTQRSFERAAHAAMEATAVALHDSAPDIGLAAWMALPGCVHLVLQLWRWRRGAREGHAEAQRQLPVALPAMRPLRLRPAAAERPGQQQQARAGGDVLVAEAVEEGALAEPRTPEARSTPPSTATGEASPEPAPTAAAPQAAQAVSAGATVPSSSSRSSATGPPATSSPAPGATPHSQRYHYHHHHPPRSPHGSSAQAAQQILQGIHLALAHSTVQPSSPLSSPAGDPAAAAAAAAGGASPPRRRRSLRARSTPHHAPHADWSALAPAGPVSPTSGPGSTPRIVTSSMTRSRDPHLALVRHGSGVHAAPANTAAAAAAPASESVPAAAPRPDPDQPLASGGMATIDSWPAQWYEYGEGAEGDEVEEAALAAAARRSRSARVSLDALEHHQRQGHQLRHHHLPHQHGSGQIALGGMSAGRLMDSAGAGDQGVLGGAVGASRRSFGASGSVWDTRGEGEGEEKDVGEGGGEPPVWFAGSNVRVASLGQEGGQQQHQEHLHQHQQRQQQQELEEHLPHRSRHQQLPHSHAHQQQGHEGELALQIRGSSGAVSGRGRRRRMGYSEASSSSLARYPLPAQGSSLLPLPPFEPLAPECEEAPGARSEGGGGGGGGGWGGGGLGGGVGAAAAEAPEPGLGGGLDGSGTLGTSQTAVRGNVLAAGDGQQGGVVAGAAAGAGSGGGDGPERRLGGAVPPSLLQQHEEDHGASEDGEHTDDEEGELLGSGFSLLAAARVGSTLLLLDTAAGPQPLPMPARLVLWPPSSTLRDDEAAGPAGRPHASVSVLSYRTVGQCFRLRLVRSGSVFR